MQVCCWYYSLTKKKKKTGLFQQTIKQKPNRITEVTKSPLVNRFYRGLNRSLHIPPLTWLEIEINRNSASPSSPILSPRLFNLSPKQTIFPRNQNLANQTPALNGKFPRIPPASCVLALCYVRPLHIDPFVIRLLQLLQHDQLQLNRFKF